ncbi:choice-of-anchor Q domain-containing protein, partial [Rhodothermus marinus]|uniref:choice-of-anchor Q domain-containing protein n=1 Tax=Rhodothermus marinus TaxID=29549 RepID=UPI000A9B5F9C
MTITGNTATTSGEGEGLYVSGPAGSLTMVNTIVAGNGSEDLFRDGPHDSAFIVRHSLIQRQRNAGLNDGVDGNLIGQDPLLGPLADNGGFSLTHALLPGSPAIDAGTSEGAPEEDQRGVSRPQGQAIDMGAYESDDATTSIEDEQEVVPAEFALHQNYPNPFDQVTHMSFGLPAPLPVRLVVYDVLGREVRTLVDEPLPAGWHRASW